MRYRNILLGSMLAMSSFSCSGGPNGPGGPATGREPDIYDGCGTDENWRTFDQYETTGQVTIDPQADPVWQGPAAGAALLASSPATLAWQPSKSSAGTANGDVTCPVPAPGAALRTDVVVPLHLSAVTGTVYDLQFSSGGSVIYRVLTTKQQLAIDKNVWAGWAGKTVSVDLVKVALHENDVVGGPYRASALSFQVTP